MEEIVNYSFRENPFMKAKDFELNERGISVSVNGITDKFIQYEEIRSIRVYYDPRAYATGSYQCKVYYKQGSFVIGTLGYKNAESPMEKRTTYSFFVNELIERVQKRNPRAVIFAGDTRAVFWTSITVIIVPILCLSGLFFYMSHPEMPDILIRLLLISFLAFLAFRYFRRNYPREIAGGGIPEIVLPKADPN